MGIKNLKRVLKINCLNSGLYTYQNLNDFVDAYKNEKYGDYINSLPTLTQKLVKSNQIKDTFVVVAVDARLYGHKYKRTGCFELGYLKQILSCLSSKIIPVYVFDGKTPDEKKDVVKKRTHYQKNNRDKLYTILNYTDTSISEFNDILLQIDLLKNKLENTGTETDLNLLFYKQTNLFFRQSLPSIKSQDLSFQNCTKETFDLKKKSTFVSLDDMENLKIFFDLLNIPHITACGEADSMIAKLSKQNIVDACLSEDSDMLPKGCKNVIHISDSVIYRYNLHKILETLKLSYESFVDYCILLGSDYFQFKKQNDPFEILDLLNNNNSIKQILENYYDLDHDCINYCISLRNIFLNSNEQISPLLKKIKLLPCNLEKITEYLFKNNINVDEKTLKTIKYKILLVNNLINKMLLNIDSP